MGRDSENEMEQIQRSLEQFLLDDLQKDVASSHGKKRIIKDTDEEELDLILERPQERQRAYQAVEPVRAKQPGKSRQAASERNTGKVKQDRRRLEAEETMSGKQDFRKRDSGVQDSKKQNSKRQDSKKKKKTHKKRRKLLLVLVSLLVLCMVGWYALVSGVYGKMTYSPNQTLAGGPLKTKGATNILLIGSDSRTEGDEGRSDAMILVSISKNTRTIQMISLLRDMYVEIPGHDGNRLNAAYSFGGPELLIETIRQNFGIEVNHYVVVNFQAFANLVDAVGGVELELTNDEVQWVNAYLNEYNMLRNMPIDTDYLDTSLSGSILLNGPQALAYSRNRYIGTDFGRTERQRKVLAAVIKKIPLAAVTNAGGLVDGLFPNLTTNLTKNECMLLSLDAPKLMTYDLVQSSIPLEGTYSNAAVRGMAVLQVDFDANKQYLQEQIYGDKR